MVSFISVPPIRPPKSRSQETSCTPKAGVALPPLSPLSPFGSGRHNVLIQRSAPWSYNNPIAQLTSSTSSPMEKAITLSDLGDKWLPQLLQDMSKKDIADILASPVLLSALANSPAATHPSLLASHENLQAALAQNVVLASQLADFGSRFAHQRSTAQAQLLSMHGLERQWLQKQSDMDLALAKFSPTSLYQLLSQSVHEQALVCQAMEESFFDRDDVDGGAKSLEREAVEWIRRYRESKVLYYLRLERKERWDEGRVGGWR